jgi:DNA-binding NarL/FixJ family response regulator
VALRSDDQQRRSKRAERGEEAVIALTQREVQVLKLLGAGLSNAVIAGELDLSSRTIGIHVGAIYRKLQVHTRTQAALVGMASGLVPIPKPPPWRASAAILVDSIVGDA